MNFGYCNCASNKHSCRLAIYVGKRVVVVQDCLFRNMWGEVVKEYNPHGVRVDVALEPTNRPS